MVKPNEKKSAKKSKLFRLPDDVINTLIAEKELSGRSETQILTDKVRGKDRFLPEVEKIIEAEMEATGRTRDEVIQFAVLDYHGPQRELITRSDSVIEMKVQSPAMEKLTAKNRKLMDKTKNAERKPS